MPTELDTGQLFDPLPGRLTPPEARGVPVTRGVILERRVDEGPEPGWSPPRFPVPDGGNLAWS